MKRFNFFGFFLALVLMLLAVLSTVAPAQTTPNYIDASSGFLKQYTFAASAARTTSSNSAVIDLGAYAGGEIFVMATAKTGTPTLDVAFQDCGDSACAHPVTLASATQFSDVGTQRIPVTGFGRYVWVTWTIGGSNTPGFTFSIVGFFKPYPNTATSPVTTNQGTAAGPSGGWPVKVTDGTSVGAVKAASTPPVAADPAQVVVLSPNGFVDPCGNPNIAKSSAVVNIGTAATTKIVDTSASTVVYLCKLVATLAGTTPTVVLKSGTHTSADCDTGAASLTGIFAPVAGSVISLGGEGGTVVKTGAGGQLCATTVGTGSSFQGVATYVQQ